MDIWTIIYGIVIVVNVITIISLIFPLGSKREPVPGVSPLCNELLKQQSDTHFLSPLLVHLIGTGIAVYLFFQGKVIWSVAAGISPFIVGAIVNNVKDVPLPPKCIAEFEAQKK